MDFGAAMFVTDYSMAPGELAPALEARGFESIWAPEHSHIPTSRRTPFPQGGELPKKYYGAMDPFVSLAAAAVATKSLKVGTGVCLVAQRDPIQTAKLVASIDQISGGRFLFGIGGGWNAEEMADHGTEFRTRFKLMRERIAAMKEIWTKSEAEYHGELVDFPPMITRHQLRREEALALACRRPGRLRSRCSRPEPARQGGRQTAVPQAPQEAGSSPSCARHRQAEELRRCQAGDHARGRASAAQGPQ